MNAIRNALMIMPLIAPLTLVAAPAASLDSALAQPQIAQDLRQKCRFPPATATDTLQQKFGADKQNQAMLIAAAQALKNQDTPAYRERMAQVVCPPQRG